MFAVLFANVFAILLAVFLLRYGIMMVKILGWIIIAIGLYIGFKTGHLHL